MFAFYQKYLSIITMLLLLLQSILGISAPKPTEYTQVKNVIVLIGDGMGFNSIEKTKLETGATLTMDSFTMRGESKTASASSPVTDSAAGGTALATGERVINGCIGVYPTDVGGAASYPMNLAELAVTQGKLAGVVTTDSTSGATPASFSAHTSARGNEADITNQQLAGDLTLIWGTKTASCNEVLANGRGFTYIDSAAEMDALEEGTRSFGQFTSDLWHVENEAGIPTLAAMTDKAIDLLDDDEDGFFLMVEGAHIDKNSHSNNGEGMKDALLSFDAAIAVALAYAKADGETLVVITADHETGAIQFINGQYVYTSGSHSGVNVPLLVYGSEDFIENGEVIKNKEVGRRIACAMGEKNFPIEIKVN